jgi:hypothetical protein
MLEDKGREARAYEDERIVIDITMEGDPWFDAPVVVERLQDTLLKEEAAVELEMRQEREEDGREAVSLRGCDPRRVRRTRHIWR